MNAFPLLVASDLDGTIVRSDGTISARTVAAFARVEAAGARFALVTGRPPRVMRGIAETFGQLMPARRRPFGLRPTAGSAAGNATGSATGSATKSTGGAA